MSTYARRIALTVTTVFGLTLSTAGQGIERTYSAEAITGWVVDAQTAQPIEGVNIVAGWRLEGGLENNYRAWFQVYEAVTDASGKFAIPKWGPETKQVKGRVRDAAPLIVLFKSGYDVRQVRNRKDAVAAHLRSDWNNERIDMRRNSEPIEQYAYKLSLSLDSIIDELLGTRECNWRRLPRFLAAVEEENKVLKQHSTQHRPRELAYVGARYGGECGNLEAFVRGYK